MLRLRSAHSIPFVCLVFGVGLALALPAGASASPTSVTAAPGSVDVTGNSPAQLDFPLVRTGDSGFDTWLHYETEDGTAAAGTDYTAASGALDLQAGETQGSVPVQVLGAPSYTPDKQFGLKLAGVVGVGPTPSFGPQERFSVGSDEVAAADLNGDGRPDLAGPNNGTVTVRLNTTAPGASSASFADPVTFTVNVRRNSPIATADLNGDGRPDLIVGEGLENHNIVSVLLNTTAPGASTPSFAAAQTFVVGEGPWKIAVADLNGDGRPDLAVSDLGPFESDVSVLLNTAPPGASSASFAARQTFLEGELPNSVSLADLNGDGKPDLIATLFNGSDTVAVLLNATAPGASSASFAAPHVFASAAHHPWSVAVTDLNGDGRPDLAIGSSEFEIGNTGTFSILLNTTAPGASTPSFAVPQTVDVSGDPLIVEAADLNGDGRPDLVFFHGNNQISVLLNITAPGASSASFAPRQRIGINDFGEQSAIADLNGDGRPDLIVGSPSAVLLNTTPAPTAAAPSFAAHQDFPTGDTPWSVASADLNGDGRRDLVSADHGANAVSALLNTTAPGASTPGFSAHQDFPAGAKPDSLAIADLNGDGRRDLIVSNEGAGTVSALLNATAPGASSTSFAAPAGFAVGGANPSSVTTADLNGDGKPDLIVANSGAGTVSILLNTTAPGAGTPSFAAQQSFATGDLAPEAITTADLNGDGKPDLIVANSEAGSLSVLLNTTAPGASTPSFAAQQAFAVGDFPLSIATADLNGDGRPDLIAANEGDNTVSVLLNTTETGETSASFAPQQAFATGNAPWSVGTADLSGDGRPDLLVANEGAGTVSVLVNATAPGATTPSFAAQQSFAAGAHPVSVTTADLNGDGGPDILTANGAANTVSALLDTQYAASISPASVTGTIHYAIPRASLGPGPLAFGELLTGTSTTKTVTLSSQGGEELAIQSIGIAGAGAGEFSQTNSCPATLTVGSSCEIAVSFAPSAAGEASATLTVTSDDPAGPETVALSGTGTELPSPPPPPTPTHTLTVKEAGSGAGSVSDGSGAIACPSACSHSYEAGSQVTLTADPAPGSRFAGWSGNGCSGVGPCQVTVGADETVTADFEKKALVPAHLRITSARSRPRGAHPRIIVTGAIAVAADGWVKVTAGASLGGRRVMARSRASIAAGRWRASLPTAWVKRHPQARIAITARFGGDASVRAARTRRSVKLR